MFTNNKIKKNQENSRKNLKNDTKINKQKFKTNSKPKSLKKKKESSLFLFETKIQNKFETEVTFKSFYS